jgi:hypothetical protein
LASLSIGNGPLQLEDKSTHADNSLCKLCCILQQDVSDDLLPTVAWHAQDLIVAWPVSLVESHHLENLLMETLIFIIIHWLWEA